MSNNQILGYSTDQINDILNRWCLYKYWILIDADVYANSTGVDLPSELQSFDKSNSLYFGSNIADLLKSELSMPLILTYTSSDPYLLGDDDLSPGPRVAGDGSIPHVNDLDLDFDHLMRNFPSGERAGYDMYTYLDGEPAELKPAKILKVTQSDDGWIIKYLNHNPDVDSNFRVSTIEIPDGVPILFAYTTVVPVVIKDEE